MDLDQQKLISMMNRMRSQVPPEEPAPECTDVSWAEPHHFNAADKEHLSDLSIALKGFLQRTMQELCDEDFEVCLKGATEHYACFLAEQFEQDSSDHYFLLLSVQGRGPVGFVELPHSSCSWLIGQTLCDPDGCVGQGEQLSSLEKTILQDVAGGITESLCRGVLAYGETLLEKSPEVLHGQWPLSIQQLEQMCRISFGTDKKKIPFEISLYLLDDVIDPMIGNPVGQATPEQNKRTPEEVIDRMGAATIEASVLLSPSMMVFRDIVTLEEGDFVLLDHKVNIPLDVRINGQEFFKAWPAQSAGTGAVVLTGQNLGS